MYLKKIRWNSVDWVHLVWDRDQLWVLVNTVMNIQFP
jgi:hypothetical protein